MKHRISLILLFLASIAAGIPAFAENPFVYPTPPENLTTLQEKSDYYISRFWDRCNFGSVFKHRTMLDKAFGDWISLMPHASADTVHSAVNKLIARFEKKGPETLALAETARNWLWSDTAQYSSEEIYMPFAQAVVENKKIPGKEKTQFRTELSIMQNSTVGNIMPDFTFTTPSGAKASFADINKGSVLIFIDDPENIDCSMARVRLASDYSTRQLVEKGQLSVLVLNPGRPTEDWKASTALLPDSWHAGATEEAKNLFDMRNAPVFIYLDSNHKVLAKGLSLDHLLNAFSVANSRLAR